MTQIRIPLGGVKTILSDVAHYGRGGVETGAMLLGRHDEIGVDTVALLGETGVQRFPDYLAISGVAMARLFEWADERNALLVAQVHSHGMTAQMSETDERFGLTVEGFISTIVPDAASPPEDPRRWGWWTFRRGRWLQTESAEVTTGACQTVVFDEKGVRDG